MLNQFGEKLPVYKSIYSIKIVGYTINHNQNSYGLIDQFGEYIKKDETKFIVVFRLV